MMHNKTIYNLLLKNYPQYKVLRDELVKLVFRQAIKTGGRVDCYVNINSFLSSIYKRPDYVYDEKLSITSSIINFAAHIREFFRSRFSIYARVFLVYGNTRPDSAILHFADYDVHAAMDRVKNSQMVHIINEDLKELSEIVKYIPEVYFIQVNIEPAVAIREIIKDQSKKGFKNARFIFSKDLYDYQLVATCPNTHLVRTKKTMQGDKTYTVSYFDFYKKLSSTLSLKKSIGDNISPELYSFYMSFAGCKDRGIKAITNYPNADKKIHDLVNSGLILNGHNITTGIDPSFAITTGIDPIVCERFRALDIIYQSNIFVQSPEYYKLNEGIIDLYNPDGIRHINNLYFKKYPLDLNVL